MSLLKKIMSLNAIYLSIVVITLSNSPLYAQTITERVNDIGKTLKSTERILTKVTKEISIAKDSSKKVKDFVKAQNNTERIKLLGKDAPVLATASSSTSLSKSASIKPTEINNNEDTALTNNEILLKVDRALNPESFTSYKKIINIDTRGVKKEFVMFIGKSGTDKVLGTFLSPKSELGRSTLRIGDNMWLYIPNVKKPIRITSLQSVIGGLFNNSDIMGLDYSTEYNCISAVKTDGKLSMVLKAKTKSVAYETLNIIADAKTYHPETIECKTASGMLVKALHFKKLTTFESGLTRPAVIETDSPLYKGAKSILIYNKLKPQKLDDELFSINSMSKYKDLRK